MQRLCLLALAATTFAACTSDSVDSDEQARRAYLGLDASVGKSIKLGFDGFNAAHSANIDPQMVAGVAKGTLTITGQVDQGNSDNKGMRLFVGMVGYDDGPYVIDDKNNKYEVVYDTDMATATQPALDMMLKGIPTGTLTGTLTGTYHLTGDIKGDVILNLMITGTLADGGGGTVIRAPGTTTISGTAMQGSGTYNVNVTL
jgi:hypothetical protein